MSKQISQLESLNKRLRTALTRKNEREISHLSDNLISTMLDSGIYTQIWDERVLAETCLLMESALGRELQECLDGLRSHLTEVRAVHTKLFAILDADVSLDVLLYSYFYTWPQLDTPISYRFSLEESNAIQELRANGPAVERISGVLHYYLMRLEAAELHDIAARLRPVIDLIDEAFTYTASRTVYALFATADQGEVLGLTIRARKGQGQVNTLNSVGPEMEKAAKGAIVCLRSISPRVQLYDYDWEIERDDIPFEGNSIGLALTVGLMTQAELWSVDPYTAFTGHVDWRTGNVQRIEHLSLKLAAARAMGIRRVFIPVANQHECVIPEELKVVAVSSVAETKQHLLRTPTERTAPTLEGLANMKITELRIALQNQGINVSDVRRQSSYHTRVSCNDFRDETFVDVYYGQSGLKTVFPQRDTPLLSTLQALCEEVFGTKPPTAAASPVQGSSPRTERYIVRDPQQQQRVKTYLFQSGNTAEEQEKNCLYRLRIERAGQVVFVRQFTSGTLTVQGSPPLVDDINQDVRSVLGAVGSAPASDLTGEEAVKQERRENQIQAVVAVERSEQWIGTDEAGKGDYFGPLVGAAVLVNATIAQQLERIGVKDSKLLSDKRVTELAERIHQICDTRAVVVSLVPDRYNTLYSEFQKEGKNLNTLLAWVHTRALENILEKHPLQRVTVIIDKFADEHYITSKLLEQGRKAKLDLQQLPKAEADIAVAAASILARAQFLQFLERTSLHMGIVLFKGSSDSRIVDVAREIVTRYGRERLSMVAKLHFVTTKKVFDQ